MMRIIDDRDDGCSITDRSVLSLLRITGITIPEPEERILAVRIDFI